MLDNLPVIVRQIVKQLIDLISLSLFAVFFALQIISAAQDSTLHTTTDTVPPVTVFMPEATIDPNTQPIESERITLSNGDVKVSYQMLMGGADYFTYWVVIYDGETGTVVFDSRNYIKTIRININLNPDATRLSAEFGLFTYPALERLVDFTAPEVGVGEQVISLADSHDGTKLAVVSIHYAGQESVFRLHVFDMTTGELRQTMETPYGSGSFPNSIRNAQTRLGFY